MQVCRGIKGIQELYSNMNAFQEGSLREEAHCIHAAFVFNIYIYIYIYISHMFSDMSQLHRLLQLKCVNDCVGWQEVKAISGTNIVMLLRL